MINSIFLLTLNEGESIIVESFFETNEKWERTSEAVTKFLKERLQELHQGGNLIVESDDTLSEWKTISQGIVKFIKDRNQKQHASTTANVIVDVDKQVVTFIRIRDNWKSIEESYRLITVEA